MHSQRPDTVHFGRRRLALALPLLACGLSIAPVQAKADIHQSSRDLMGTRVDLTLQSNDPSSLPAAAAAAFAEMTRLSNMMSRYCSTSVVTAVNQLAGLRPVPVPVELMEVLRTAQLVAQSTQGAFDTTVGSLRDWDFDPQHPSIPTPRQIAAQLDLVDQRHGLVLNAWAGTAFLTTRGMRLDLGGIAKHPILQAGQRQLQRHGVTDAMINGGGDVLVMGHLNGRAWRIGLRDPRQPSQLLGMVSLSDGMVAASGDYERFVIQDGKRLHHILDPKTGYPSQGPHGVTLISRHPDLVNGLGTAIMVEGAKAGRARLAQMPAVDALIVDADGSLWRSPGMAKRMKRG